MHYPRYSQGIKLNMNSSDLECTDGKYIKKCIVPKEHFEGKQNDYYYTYYLNFMGNLSVFNEISPLKVVLPKNNEIIIRIKQESNQKTIKIGTNGVIYFVTDTNETNLLIEGDIEKIEFNSKIYDDDDNRNEYETRCKFWKPINDNIRIICKLDKNLKYHFQNITLNKESFNNGDNIITIYPDAFLEVEQLNYEISFLYSDQQIINIENENELYYLSFKYESYNELEKLYLSGKFNNYIILNECNTNENKIINCSISKNKLEELLVYKNEIFSVGGINDNIGLMTYECVFDINVNYNIEIQKENIYVNLTSSAEGSYEIYTQVAIETNVTNIPNLITRDFSGFLYLKKVNGFPLQVFFNGTMSFTTNIEFKTERILDNIHYKYNFIIQPSEHYIKVNFQPWRGSYIKFIYPEEFDLSFNESVIIRYIMPKPSTIKLIRLNPNSEYLNCEDLIDMKKCTVPYKHFLVEKSGDYYTYHTNHYSAIQKFYESPVIKVNLKQEKIIDLYVKDEDNNNRIFFGTKGIIYFKTNYTDNENIFDSSDIEEKTIFETTISDVHEDNYYYSNNYNVTCRLWKPINEKIRIFCDLNQKTDNENIKLNSAIFDYKGFKIAIASNMTFVLKLITNDNPAPFIYSSEQTIDVERASSYNLNFKMNSYNNDSLLILTAKENEIYNIILNDCKIQGKNLNCKIEKNKIEEVLSYSGQKFKCYYYNNNLGRPFELPNIFDIKINYNINEKENVYIKIVKLLDNYIDLNNFIPYETNITSITNVISGEFIINSTTEFTCMIKKSSEKPLLILCHGKNEGNFSLGVIENEIRLDNINVKYNFLIQPVSNEEIVEIKGIGSTILFVNPIILDITIHSTGLIKYYMTDNKNSTGLKLNLASSELECINNDYNSKHCFVPRTYFNGKSNGYFYTYHLNHKNEYSIFYELSPIKVILSAIINIRNKENPNPIKVGKNGVLILITDYNDENINIFNIFDIEDETTFYGKFIGNNSNFYNPHCRLWKPQKENIRMICKFDTNLLDEKIKFIDYNLTYHGTTIRIISEEYIAVKQLESEISFIYSDEQTINLEDDSNSYTLQFKKEIYNNEPLFLYNNEMRAINLDCKNGSKELICNIKGSKILESLSYNGEKYYVYQWTNLEGLLKLDGVLDISINYNNAKEDIYLNITKLITLEIDKNNYIVYETNITNISNVNTDIFILSTSGKGNLKCFFKKYRKDQGKLLLLCDSEKLESGSLNEISAITIKNIHALYNFIIPKTFNNHTFSISKNIGIKISFVYPEELNFTSKDILTIKLKTEQPHLLNEIKLNNNSNSNLECKNGIQMKECTVSKDHFKSSGYYNIYYKNSFGYNSISYEISPIQVSLKEEGEGKTPEEKGSSNLAGILAGSIIGGVVVIGIVVFLVIRYYKRKNPNNKLIEEENNGTSIPLSSDA